jgi:dihydrolipoamide dehydrogenase
MADEKAYDVVVLGGGPGGYAAAFRASQLGLKVAMVERDKVGGTCLHRGCIPTKGLLHAAEVFETIQDAKSFGINAGQPEVDWAAVQAAKNEPVKKLYAGLSSVVKARKVDLVQGEGNLGDRGTIVVRTKDGERALSGRNVVIAAGSFARSLPGLDVDGQTVVTSDHALTSETLPRSIAVIGAGAVGVEFASIYRSFGVEVTLIEALPRIVPLEDPDVSKELAAAFTKRGIAVHAGAAVKEVDGGKVTFEAKGKPHTIEVDQVLVAVGRGPSTDGLDLDRWGITTDRGFIVADDRLRTADNTWAIGDCVAGAPQLAHAAFRMAIYAVEQIAGENPIPINFEREIAGATYCVPEVASVGLHEQKAKERGHDVVCTKHPYVGNAKAQILHQPRGFVKIVADRDGGILGIHMIGPRVTENVAEALLAVGWEAMPAELASLIHPHPTLSEGIGETALAAIGKALHG